MIWGCPGIAFSLDPAQNQLGLIDFEPAAKMAEEIVQYAIEDPLPTRILLNVNVPRPPIRGIRITRQGWRIYRDRLDRRQDPRGQPYYWIGGEAPGGIPALGTDIGALTEGYDSITPLDLDLTAYQTFPALRKWSTEERFSVEALFASANGKR